MPLTEEETNNLRQNVSSGGPVSGEHSFYPPQSGDSRSPCPALNALANHGYINRDGRNISPCSIHHCLKACYGLSTVFALFLTLVMLAATRSIIRLDLHDLARHNVVEHDASLVHLDTPDGEEFAPITIDQNLVDEVMNDIRPKDGDSSGTGPVMGVNDAARARFRRENECRPINKIQQEIARGEIALTLSVWEITSKSKVGAPAEVIRRFLSCEMLPDNWKPTHTQGLWNLFQRSQALRRAVEEMRNGTDKTATTSGSGSNINDNDERQALLSSSKKSRSYRIF